VPEKDKTAIEAAMTDLRGALEGQDRDKIISKLEALARSAMKLGEAAYAGQSNSAGAQPSGPEGPASGGGAGEGVVDAEFEEVRDDEGKKKSA
jgi:molecular chaperone DnaK